MFGLVVSKYVFCATISTISDYSGGNNKAFVKLFVHNVLDQLLSSIAHKQNTQQKNKHTMLPAFNGRELFVSVNSY